MFVEIISTHQSISFIKSFSLVSFFEVTRVSKTVSIGDLILPFILVTTLFLNCFIFLKRRKILRNLMIPLITLAIEEKD